MDALGKLKHKRGIIKGQLSRIYNACQDESASIQNSMVIIRRGYVSETCLKL